MLHFRLGFLTIFSIQLCTGDFNNVWYMSVFTNPPVSSTVLTPKGTYGLTKNWLIDDGDVKNRNVGNSSSIFSKTFSLDSTELEAPRLLLVFHGVDTFAKVTLNNHELGRTSNMFVRYVYDVKEFCNTTNNLFLEFESAVKVAEKLHREQSKNYTVYPTCVPNAYNGECHVNHIRKMQASFGWDWGPAFPGSAIWRDVQLIAVKQAVIMDHTVDVYQLTPGVNWRVEVTVLLQVAPNSPDKPVTARLQVLLPIADRSVMNSTEVSVSNGQKNVTVSILLDVPEAGIERWWPNGYGSQRFYTLETNLIFASGTESRSKRIGFRTVELVQEPLAKGLSFYLRINNVPIFAKGSNLIPISALPEMSKNHSYVEHLLLFASEAHMNMLRVWGGGIYESDEFYDLTDSMGIMIWQDFMFACSMYPTTPEFLESVREEVVQNVWRLKSHPSVVIWAGNNENEAALYGNWYGTKDDKVYRDDYVKLYVDVIKRQVEELDPYRPYVVSSPSNGRWAEDNGWIGSDPYSSHYGDVHWYNYIANGWDYTIYPRPRFASEYGVQSLPSIHNMRSATSSPGDLAINSKFLKHRQHLTNGSIYLQNIISMNLKIPQSTGDSLKDLQHYIYLSQINQAQSVKVETELFRQMKSIVNDAGEGKTMGALYWQLNDVWSAPSWSSIDTDQRWKMLHYFVKNAFAPIIISPRVTAVTDLEVYIVSDELQSRFNCTVELNVYKISSGILPAVFTRAFRNVTVLANASYLFKPASMNLDDLLHDASCGPNVLDARKKCIVELVLKDSMGKLIAPVNYAYPAPPKDMTLPVADLSVRFDPTFVSEGYRITINTGYTTQLFVWIDYSGSVRGRFSDNGFHILQGEKTIYWKPAAERKYHVDPSSFSAVALGQIYPPN